MHSKTPSPRYGAMTAARGWTLFACAMIALAPIFGSVTTAAEIVAAIVILLFIRRDGLPPVSSAQRIAVAILLAYFAYFVVRGWFTPDWNGYGSAILSISGFVYFVPLFLFLPSVLAELSAKRISAVATATICVTFVLALIFNLGLHVDRVHLFAGNALPFAAIVLITCFLAPLGWPEKSRRERVLAIVAVLLGLATIAFLAKARGPAVAWGVLLLPLLVYIGGTGRRAAIAVAMAIAAVVVAVLVAIVLLHDTETFQRYLAPIHYLFSGGADGHIGPSIGRRFVMYKAGIRAFVEHPIFGYGPQNRFSGALPYMDDPTFHYHHLHNLFLTHAVGGGIVGILVLSAFLVIPLIGAYASPRRNADTIYMAWILTLGMVGFGMTNMLSFYDLTVSFCLFNMVLLLALASAPAAGAADSNEDPTQPNG